MMAYYLCMRHHTVYLVGKGVFAETLHLLLTSGEESPGIILFSDFHKVIETLRLQPPEILILVDQNLSDEDFAANLEELWPDLPVIWANIKNDFLRLIPSLRVPSTREGLFQAIELMTYNR